MRQESLSEKRFGDLLKSASLFFAAAEGDSEQEKRAAIEDIYALMAEYGLTFDDLK